MSSVRAELVVAPSFFLPGSEEKGVGFDRLSPNGLTLPLIVASR
ncbi:MAG: hypothetical protein QOJ94_3102 [Sphingomonadales bacterium]|nr:hypothetical protein [Sphingomonadales bacterium]